MDSTCSVRAELSALDLCAGSKIHSLERLPHRADVRAQPDVHARTGVRGTYGSLCPTSLGNRDAIVGAESRAAKPDSARLEVVAQALADAAQYQGASWQTGPQDLARAMLAPAVGRPV
jgi:hypothetical protein